MKGEKILAGILTVLLLCTTIPISIFTNEYVAYAQSANQQDTSVGTSEEAEIRDGAITDDDKKFALSISDNNKDTNNESSANHWTGVAIGIGLVFGGVAIVLGIYSIRTKENQFIIGDDEEDSDEL